MSCKHESRIINSYKNTLYSRDRSDTRQQIQVQEQQPPHLETHLERPVVGGSLQRWPITNQRSAGCYWPWQSSRKASYMLLTDFVSARGVTPSPSCLKPVRIQCSLKWEHSCCSPCIAQAQPSPFPWERALLWILPVTSPETLVAASITPSSSHFLDPPVRTRIV